MENKMNTAVAYRETISKNGFAVIENVFSKKEVDSIVKEIDNAENTSDNFRRSNDLFAIRQFFKEIPCSVPLVFTNAFKQLTSTILGEGFFPVKSIYFDKPGKSNWFVAWHQDLMIAVKEKHELEGYGPWTIKQNQYSVQPPVEMLENNFTIRIHLDDADENNGALKVIPGSHTKGAYKAPGIEKGKEIFCNVGQGGIMIMKPLLMHASGRTVNSKRRRVIHIEFSNQQPAFPLQWSETLNEIIYT